MDEAQPLAFLRQIDRAYSETELHLVVDDDATHKTPEVKTWLQQRPASTSISPRPPGRG